MQMSQSSPSPDWLGLAGSGEEAISKKKTGRKFILILELCSLCFFSVLASNYS